MALGRTIKDLALFNEGAKYCGEIASVKLPTLARKFDEWRGGGMDSPVSVDVGGEAIVLEWTARGPVRLALAQYGEPLVDGNLLRFTGTYDDEEGGLVTIDIVVRGRHQEIDPGEAKVGELGEFKVKTHCAYYRLDWDGQTLIEIDPMNMILTVDGSDRMAERRARMGF